MSDSIHPKSNHTSTYTFHGSTKVPASIAAKVHEIVQNRKKTTEGIAPPDPIPIIEYKNIRLGRLLGTGSFSSAFTATCLLPSKSSLQGPLVMKKFRPEVLKNPFVFAACAADLEQEGQILASMEHPNIISLRAWSGPQMIQKYLVGSHVSAFLILEPLDGGTLEARFAVWAKRKPKFYYSKKRKAGVLTSLQHEKCQHILSLAKALDHIHGYHVLHRDIKAGNIGFANGMLKIFDFDLARVLPLGRDRLFQLTANVGSPRYMAPEVRRGDQYNLKADVFSFGVLVYQIFTLKKSFRSPEATECDWSQANKTIPFNFSGELRKILQQCMAPSLVERPHMDKVRSMLQVEIEGEAFDLDKMTEIPHLEAMAAMENSTKFEQLPSAPSSLDELTAAESKDEGEDIFSSNGLDKATTSNNTDTILWVTYLNIVLYALCYQLQQPVEPFLIQSLIDKQSEGGGEKGQVNRAYGNLQSFFQAIQTVGSPLVGILLDRLGIQKTSALVFLASGLSYALLAMATDMTSLFLSKVPTVLMAAFLVAQATATTTLQADLQHSPSMIAAARAAALGRMTTAYTVGATLGPTIGGNLANQGDYSIGAKLAVAGSLLSALLSMWFLPDTAKTSEPREDKSTLSGKPSGASFLNQLQHSGSLLVRSGLWPLLMIKVVGGVIASMHSTTMPLVMTKELHLEPSQLGLIMSSSMFAVAAFGAVAMAPLTRQLHNAQFFGMIQIGLIFRAIMGFGMAWIVSFIGLVSDGKSAVYNVIAVAVFHALASHTLATGLTTQTTGMVSKEEQGALLGLEHGLFSLARIIGPTIGTRLLEWGGLWSVEITCGFLDVVLAVLSVVLIAKKEKSL